MSNLYKMVGKILLVTYTLISCIVKLCESGECCKPHYDLLAGKQDGKWCDMYCCLHLPNLYDCCNNEILRAPVSERESFCQDYLSKNVWAPILITIFGLLLVVIVVCCVGCCKCCCGSRRTQVNVQSPQQPNLVVLSQTQTGQSHTTGDDAYHVGYDQE